MAPFSSDSHGWKRKNDKDLKISHTQAAFRIEGLFYCLSPPPLLN
ncbi:hypothetical protein M899_1223 [Bacteriovorax sp. BSW11_IV]|nr:hypothetical protein M899_1223 [Bacteriovorax sp. BSW11_IV]